MTGVQTLVARTILGSAVAVTGLAAMELPWLRRSSTRAFDRVTLSALVISRLGLYSLIFLILRIAPRGDVVAYYFKEASGVLQHGTPYLDFPSSYGPLHPYLDAAALLVWRSPLALILLAIVAELCLVPVWLRLARRFIPEQSLRTAAILYVFSPLSVQYVAIDGQNSILVALLLVLAIYALYLKRSAISGGLLALGVVCVKFLPLVYVPIFFLAASRRMRWLAGLALTLVLGYSGFAWLGSRLIEPIRYEGSLKSASNVTYLIESLSALVIPKNVADAVLALALLAVVGLVARALRYAPDRAGPRIVTFGMAALTLALVVFAKKSWPAYLILALFPICLAVGSREFSRLRIAAFQIFNVVAIVQQSVWASILGQFQAGEFHAALVAGRPPARIFLVLLVGLLAGYFWLLYESIRQIAGNDANVGVDSLRE